MVVSFHKEWTSFLRNSTHMQGNKKKYSKKKNNSICVLIKNSTIIFARRKSTCMKITRISSSLRQNSEIFLNVGYGTTCLREYCRKLRFFRKEDFY